jgi:Rod binding domain-containing protein
MIDKLQNMYGNQLSEINTQLSEATRRVTANNEPQTIDSNARNSEIKEVAKELEAVFSYQLIKEMRKMSESISSENGLGSSTYTSLFDMEISKLFADSGLGLQDTIVRWLERAPNTANINNSDETADIPETETPEKARGPQSI